MRMHYERFLGALRGLLAGLTGAPTTKNSADFYFTGKCVTRSET